MDRDEAIALSYFLKSDCGCGCAELSGPCDDCAPPCVIPTISGGGTTQTGTEGEAFSGGFSATGDPTITYGATGLPPGLSINSSTGAFAGTPTTAGTYVVSISATNGCGSDSDTLTIEIEEPPPVPCSDDPVAACWPGGRQSGRPAGAAADLRVLPDVAPNWQRGLWGMQRPAVRLYEVQTLAADRDLPARKVASSGLAEPRQAHCNRAESANSAGYF